MARPSSVAKAGFYPTPQHLIPQIMRLMRVETVSEYPNKTYTIVDPCCGEGDALQITRNYIQNRRPSYSPMVHVYGCELSQERAEIASGRCHSYGNDSEILQGDAFTVTFKHAYDISLLWLNPPYDHDREYGRLEERFLHRFAPMLPSSGVLVYIIPFYALASSAETIAREFDQVRVFKFPQADFMAFKQVVLIAVKRSSTIPNAQLVERLQSFSSDSDLITELPAHPEALVDLPEGKQLYSAHWSMAPFDLEGVLEDYQLWGNINGVIPSIHDRPVFPSATALRPAHISAGIAAGLLDGLQLDAPGKPSLLIKGVFDRDYITVDEKRNKEGEVVGEIQVQSPTLRVSVLELATGVIRPLQSVATRTGKLETVGDLIADYETSLLRALQAQCPVMYDPKTVRTEVSSRVARKPFRAQAQVSTALSMLTREHGNAMLLGEIGCGKTGTALTVAANRGSKRTLVMCPPHLLDSWKEQVNAVLPDTQVVVLNEPDDVRRLASDPTDQHIVAILSRETAKLGHGIEGVSIPANPKRKPCITCPACGTELVKDHLDPDKQARLRLRCTAQRMTPANASARLLELLSTAVIKTHYNHRVVQSVLGNRIGKQLFVKYAAKPPVATDEQAKIASIVPLVVQCVGRCEQYDVRRVYLEVLARLLIAANNPSLIIDTCTTLWAGAQLGNDCELAERVLELVLLAPIPQRIVAISRMQKHCKTRVGIYGSDDWRNWFNRAEREDALSDWRFSWLQVKETPISEALEKLNSMAKWNASRVCNEALFQAIPQPRRVALGSFISKRYPKLFDLFLLDEFQEYGEENSAQSKAAHRICALKVPTIMLSGSSMNGYARSLFINLWSVSKEFRKDYKRDQIEEFVEKFGYKKRIVEHKKQGKVVVFGSQSDRVETQRDIGDAPGVLPQAVLKYILPVAVTLQRSDLDADLPLHHECVEYVAMNTEQSQHYHALQKALVEQIKRDAFTPKNGKLYGAMSELPSYLDRASKDVGNIENGDYQIAYAEEEGGKVVATAPGIDASIILPKEQWMLRTIEAQLKLNRRSMVFGWHLNLMPRLARLVEKELGITVAQLKSAAVPTHKRQAWINEKVIGKKCKVLFVNPVAVQTGLNNLVWFQNTIWMQNPACNPLIYRQANGRIDRIGKTTETYSFFPLYRDSLQVNGHRLLMNKVSVSQSTDGLDPESALIAAGVGENTARLGLSIGKQLYEMLRVS